MCPAGLAVPKGTVLVRSTLRSIAVLAILGFIITGINLMWTAHEVRIVNESRCSVLASYATIPLPHPVVGNPSIEWEAAFEHIARQRAKDLGCSLN